MKKQEIPILTAEEFQELVGKKQTFNLSLDPIKNKIDLNDALIESSFDGLKSLYVIANSKRAFIGTVEKHIQKNICAKSTPIKKFPIGEWIPCWIGDPFEKELCLIGKVEVLNESTYFVFKTREGDLILSWNKFDLKETSYLQPVPEEG
jgi:hypothetical protein